jgi:hypothetical protein
MEHSRSTTIPSGPRHAQAPVDMSAKAFLDLSEAMPAVWNSIKHGARIPSASASQVAAGILFVTKVAQDPACKRLLDRSHRFVSAIMTAALPGSHLPDDSSERGRALVAVAEKALGEDYIANTKRDERLIEERMEPLRTVLSKHSYTYQERANIINGYCAMGAHLDSGRDGIVPVTSAPTDFLSAIPALVPDVRFPPTSASVRMPDDLLNCVRSRAPDLYACAVSVINGAWTASSSADVAT